MPELPVAVPQPWVKVSDDTVMRSKLRASGQVVVAFGAAKPPPMVVPQNYPTADLMANDEQIIEVNAWAAEAVCNGAYFNGVTFLGYPYLAELAQRPEYRRVSEVLATEATRKWIKLQHKTATDDAGQNERVAELIAEMTSLDVQGAFRKMAELDGFFGRAHLYLDTGSTDDRNELVTPIGDGRNTVTLAKFKGKTGFLKAVKPIEPVWCYPAKYNANDPLKPDWYNPQSWFCQGKEIHVTRLLPFVGREVPDLLKPSYSFGGLSLSQMVKPYVDNWLRTRQSVADLIWSFSVRGIKTNMAASLAADGKEFFNRMAVFTNVQNNQGLMALDKDTEDFFNIVTPLGSLDALQAQSQEHMSSVSGIPIVKLLGIQPAGLNASSEGELTVWYDWVEAFQEKFFTARLSQVIDFIMLSLWGEIDEDITFAWESLRALTDLEQAELDKAKAETAAIYVEASVLAPEEVRAELVKDPDSTYADLSDEAPTDSFGEEVDEDDDAAILGERQPREDRDEPRRDSEQRRPGNGAQRAAERIRGPEGLDAVARTDRATERG